MREKPLYQELANLVQARFNANASGNREWVDRHRERAEELVKAHMPSGSGFDNGTRLDWQKSTRHMLVFHTSFHHMSEHGVYDGWTEHVIRVRADLLSDFDVSISGRDRNQIKDHAAELFDMCLRTVVKS